MSWDDPNSDPIGDVQAQMRRMRMLPPTRDTIATMFVPRTLIAMHGLTEVTKRANEQAVLWGFAAARVIPSGEILPVPAKEAHKRRFNR